MKRFFIVAILTVIPVLLFAQNTSQLNCGQVGFTAERARLEKTFTNFTATSDDTSGYFTINVPGWASDPLLCPDVRLIGVATDSISADVYVLGRNGTLTTAITASYADSIVGTSNTSNTTVIVLKAQGTDRLSGCTQFKVGTVFRATGQGTTSGRTMKWYLEYVLR